MILIAYWLPGLEDRIPLDLISEIGVSGIFFFYGLKLSLKQMSEGLSNWKLHLLVQTSTFLIFPILVLVALPFITNTEQFTLWLAVFFLAALPSTVSSSVVMVSIAKGNIPGAVFNASISGLIGIFVTPIWIGVFLETSTNSFEFAETLVELCLKILLPVVIGLALHRYLGKFAIKHKNYLTIFDKTVILIIVYKSFSASFTSGVFDSIKFPQLLVVGGGAIGLFFVVYLIIFWLADRLGFNREDKITALFCGSKKSLVHGTVFSSVLFAGISSAGIFLVPIMIYHAFQLFFVSIISQKYHDQAN